MINECRPKGNWHKLKFASLTKATEIIHTQYFPLCFIIQYTEKTDQVNFNYI